MPLSSDLLSAQRGRRYALNKVRLKKSQTVARPCGFLAQRFDQLLIVADVIDVVRHQRTHETYCSLAVEYGRNDSGETGKHAAFCGGEAGIATITSGRARCREQGGQDG